MLPHVVSGGAQKNFRQFAETVRDEFDKTGQSPTLRAISKRSGVDTKTLYALFPKGPAKKVARIAGLGKPKGCI